MISPVHDSSVRLIRCGRALSRSGLSDVDYALNPYYGCAHGCLYCYAPDVMRCERGLEWGEWVEARIDISRRLRREITRIGTAVIGLSTVTDPYQPAEEQLGLTRACLQVISESDASLMLMTKSPLVLRDLDILVKLKDAEVCVTITTLDDSISSLFEAKVAKPQERLALIGRLAKAGIRTDAMISPFLSRGPDWEHELEELIGAIADSGCRSITFDRLRLRETGRARLKKRFSGTEHESLVEEVTKCSENIEIEPFVARIARSNLYPGMAFHIFSW